MKKFAFYNRVVALNSDVHRNLRFAAQDIRFSFAADTTAVLIAGVEFAEASKEYPIVFIRGRDGQMRPVALLGVRDGENLYVDGQGGWDAGYIPAFVRRYPFVLAEGGANGELTVCIDESCDALNAGHGELLFDAEGKFARLMHELSRFLQNFQREFARTEQIIKQLDELGLFIEQGARFDTGAGESFQLNDFYLIDEAKFGKLADDLLPRLFRSGAFGLVYLHLASLGNMRKLLDRVAARAAARARDASPADKPLH